MAACEVCGTVRPVTVLRARGVRSMLIIKLLQRILRGCACGTAFTM